MKKLIKYIFTGLVIFSFAINTFAQTASDSNAQADTQIELPDLTTVVTSEDQEETAPAPDFENVLDHIYNSGELVPELPQASVGADGDVLSAGDSSVEKDIYASGQIGGGYPALFSGNFEVSRLFGADPFRIAFNHYSASGFASHNLADGFSSKNTWIELEKEFVRQNLDIKFSGRYEDIGNGLQSRAESVSANNQDSIELSGIILWNFAGDFHLDFSVDSEFYYRFADITYNSSESFVVQDWIKNTSRVTAEPKLALSWVHNGFDISLDGFYSLEAWSKVSNRGQFDFNFAWSNESLKLYAGVGVAFGNNIGQNPVVVPFKVGLDAALPVYFSDRKLNLSLNGGIDSKRLTTSQLESKYKFSGMNQFTEETSDWFGNFSILVPLKTSFTGKAAVSYKTTAFRNGEWAPSYADTSLTNGLYGFEQREHDELCTDFSFTWKYKLFAATANYHANWMDIPVLENRHTVSVSFALQSQKSRWGVNLDTAYLLDVSDNKPLINLEGYVQASDAVRIVLSVNDMLKLLGAEERSYAGQYAASGGNAMLLVKFLF